MKRHRRLSRIMMSLIAAGLLATSTGCVYELLMSHVSAFTAGWVLREATIPTTTETQCFRNGVEIDCSQLP